MVQLGVCRQYKVLKLTHSGDVVLGLVWACNMVQAIDRAVEAGLRGWSVVESV